MTAPRHLAHRGSVVATGFVIDTELVGVLEARRRVLALWRAGATVREHGALLVISGLRAERVRVAFAPGLPLVEQHGALAAFPLADHEAEAFAGPGRIVLVRGGAVEALALRELREVDISHWLDLGDFTVVRAAPLAPPPPRVEVPPPPEVDVRTLTGVPAGDAGAAELLEALRRAREGGDGRWASRTGGATATGLSWWQRLKGWFGDRRAQSTTRTAGSSDSSSPPSSSRALVPVKSSWLERLREQLALTAWRSRLGAELGRRHAEYLRRMLEMFDRGELDEALRHAVPLGGDGDSGGRLRLGLPQRRSDLNLSFTRQRGGSVIPAADSAMEMMRERYRAAATRLEQAGRIDEAAFVYAELLGDVDAAIALLERHRRYAVAARLAEGRELAPGLVVRLWFLAGDRQRAIDVARRHEAWADAIARLERARDDQAAVLRMLWADHLADIGDFVQAVEVAWPLEPSRALVETWIDRGIAGEGVAAARLMVKKLVVAPHAFAEVGPKLVDVIDARDASGRRSLEAMRRRIALVEELLASPSSAELRTLARPALRALLHDCGSGMTAAPTSSLVERLLRYADDPALRADRPPLPSVARGESLLARDQPITLRWSAGDAGTIPVYDVAALPGGRTLVALGELGVRIVGPTGKTVAHFEQPATRLVVSDHGSRAIAHAPRGQVHRIARFDLIERSGEHWCDAEFDSSASTYSGDVWLASKGRQVVAIDATSAGWRALWGVELPATFLGAGVRREDKYFAIEDPLAGELWFYEGFTLRRRDVKVDVPCQRFAGRPSSQDWVAVTETGIHGPGWHVALLFPGAVHAIETHRSIVAIAQPGPDGVVVSVVHRGVARTLARLYFDGAARVAIRIADDTLTVADDRGRVAVVDLDTGTLVRELKITV